MSRTVRRRKGNHFNTILLEHKYVGAYFTHKNRLRYPGLRFTDAEIEELFRNHNKNIAAERARFYADGCLTRVRTTWLKQDTKVIERRHVRDHLSRVTIEEAEEFDLPCANTRSIILCYR